MAQRGLVTTLVLLVPLTFFAQSPPQRLDINGARVLAHLEALSSFGRTLEGGVSRVAFSQADRDGRNFVTDLMRDAGLDVRIDAAGNIIGRRAGRDSTLPPLMLGSHIDSVPDGGNYDGQVGSIGAIEVAQALDEAGVTTRHPLEVVIFANEEAGKIGSRAMSGELEMPELDLISHSGKTNRDGIAFIGGDPANLASARRVSGDLAAYLELHIEQGAILDHEAIDIGVVEGIVGIRRWDVVFEGLANHAGTTPMSDRRDAILAAARFVDAVNRIVTSIPGRQVGTVGRIEASPGVPSVIAGRVRASLELRELDMDKMESIYQDIHAEGEQIARDTGTTFTATQFNISRAAPTDARLRQVIADVASDLGLTHMRMPSGAGHDAQIMAGLGPVGMIFIPSLQGISHSPQELSQPEDIVNGVRVLLGTLLRLDDADGPLRHER